MEVAAAGPSRSHPVWQRLDAYQVGPETADFSFIQRLAHENGWSLAQSGRVMEEYRRFCFLAVTGSGQATPSDAVDQAWHLHLTFTHDYWQRFCPEVLGRPLHHRPTAGGPAERARFFEQYAQTLRRYEQVFGAAAPADIWPGAAQRLLQDPRARRVHPRDAIIIPRHALRRWLRQALLLALLALGLAVLLQTLVGASA
ncbi:hypothetical protein D8I35_13155 [Corticibacter populi]|uniref:Uncharacterized protein n=1 Tax=Corticibacter populi TaxID=1550736 RepID=A0A3M6QRM1_9BURK|nr:hypothetical protein D8I35_13155 [Corticibacter populi]